MACNGGEPAVEGGRRTATTLVARHSGKALDVCGVDGRRSRVIQFAPHRGENQQWRLEPVGAATIA